jgi:ABC-type sugar transport system substrate-binding protein
MRIGKQSSQVKKEGENKMKISKVVLLVVVLAMLVAMVGCGPAATPAPTQAPTPAPKAGAACAPNCTYEDLVVGFIQTGSEGGWRTANTGSFKETAEQLGLTLKFYDAQNKLENQVSAFHQFNQDPEVNVIILAALETTGWDDVLKEAQANGKTVVLEDRRIDASEDLYATYIGSDFAEEGRKSAVEMCKLLEGSEKKNVWELVGNVGSSAAKDRGQGFREKMGECGITIPEGFSQTGNWSATEGKAVTEAFLKKSKDVQGIFAQNDEMGLGAIEALKEAGLKPGVDVKILSVDATAGAFKAMIAGDLNVTVECNPLLAPQVYEAALKALNGESLPKWVPSQEGVFYAADAETILPTRKY